METELRPAAPEIDLEIVKAFHLMWDIFPSPSALLRKDRTVVACNPAAAAIGYKVGDRCFQSFGDKSVHKHCRANEALRDGLPQRAPVYNSVHNRVNDSYWLPLAGRNDLFVHTVINITDFAKPDLFQLES